MREELQQFASERAERIRLLQERQMRELEQFDEESTRRGFRFSYLLIYFMKNKIIDHIYYRSFILIYFDTCSALALTEPSREVYQEDDAKSGSMLSLVHSNSYTSNPNSL